MTFVKDPACAVAFHLIITGRTLRSMLHSLIQHTCIGGSLLPRYDEELILLGSLFSSGVPFGDPRPDPIKSNYSRGGRVKVDLTVIISHTVKVTESGAQ